MIYINMNSVHFVCIHCGDLTPGGMNETHARDLAIISGWKINGDVYTCDKCQVKYGNS